MKILILTRNLDDYDTGGKSEAVIQEENAFGYGRVNIKDALAIKKTLNGLHDTKVVCLYDDVYSQIQQEKPDVVFNLCDDGFRGDTRLEPHVAAMFDILDVPYTGNNYFTIALCQNKARTKDILTYNNILTPKFQVFTSAERKLNPELKFPLIVKPIREDGSLGIRERSVINNEEELKEEIDRIINIYEQEALVEEYIDGREFTVPLIGNKRPVMLPIVEIDLSELPEGVPKIVSYKAKWTKQSKAYKVTKDICPANIDEKLHKSIEEIAKKCYKIFGCRGYARVDFRYNEKENKLYVLEINPNPDLSEECYLPKASRAANMTQQDLILKLIDLAIERRD